MSLPKHKTHFTMKKKPDGLFKQNGNKALEFLQGDDSSGDGMGSPLAGKSWWRVITTIVVAIAIPGGLYVLAALVILPLIAKFFIRRSNKRTAAGDEQKALANANRAVKLSRNSPAALIHRAELLLAQGDHKAALEDVQKSIKKKKKYAPAYYVRAKIAEAQGQQAAAIADYAYFLEFQVDQHEEQIESQQ